jgi:hypothetical protein
MSQNKDFAKTYAIMHQKQSSQDNNNNNNKNSCIARYAHVVGLTALYSKTFIGFSYEKSAGHRHRYRQCFLFGKILYKNVHNLFRSATSTEEK